MSLIPLALYAYAERSPLASFFSVGAGSSPALPVAGHRFVLSPNWPWFPSWPWSSSAWRWPATTTWFRKAPTPSPPSPWYPWLAPLAPVRAEPLAQRRRHRPRLAGHRRPSSATAFARSKVDDADRAHYIANLVTAAGIAAWVGLMIAAAAILSILLSWWSI